MFADAAIAVNPKDEKMCIRDRYDMLKYTSYYGRSSGNDCATNALEGRRIQMDILRSITEEYKKEMCIRDRLYLILFRGFSDQLRRIQFIHGRDHIVIGHGSGSYCRHGRGEFL